MKCCEAQNLIITDLVDHELSPENGPALNSHLEQCAQCRKYKEEVLMYAVNPFKTIERKAPPPEVWNNIRHAIEQNTRPAFSLKGIFNGFFTFPKAAFIPVAAAALLLVSLMVYKQPSDTAVNTADNTETTFTGQTARLTVEPAANQDENYFSYVYDGFEEDTEAESSLGTAAEELILGKIKRNFSQRLFV